MWKQKRYNKEILIFLDIDGVLNTSNSFNTRYEISDENVKALHRLITKLYNRGCVAKIILTSTWRLGYDSNIEKCSPQIQKLLSKLVEVGVTICDKTPIYKEKTRDVEIRRYLRGYELNHSDFTYIILDDDISVFDEKELKTMNFYKVNQHTGLTVKDIDKIIDMVL
jgi:hypothetical protein